MCWNRSIEIANTCLRGMSLSMLPDLDTSQDAYRGDLIQKEDLLLWFGSQAHPDFLLLIQAEQQSAWLKEHRPALVPPKNPNGTPPSDHTVSTVFETQYSTDFRFRREYFLWVVAKY